MACVDVFLDSGRLSASIVTYHHSTMKYRGVVSAYGYGNSFPDLVLLVILDTAAVRNCVVPLSEFCLDLYC